MSADTTNLEDALIGEAWNRSLEQFGDPVVLLDVNRVKRDQSRLQSVSDVSSEETEVWPSRLAVGILNSCCGMRMSPFYVRSLRREDRSSMVEVFQLSVPEGP